MLSIGGLDPRAANLTAAWNDTDPFWEGMKVFDLTDLKWTNYYNATARPYVAPTVVAAHYASGPQYPSTWSNSDLQSLFMGSQYNGINSTFPSQPSAEPTARPQSPSQTKSHTAQIVGGTTGGVVGAVLVAFVGICLLLCMRRRAGREREQATIPSTM